MKDIERIIKSYTGNPDADNRSWRSFVTPVEKTGASIAETEAKQKLYTGEFSSSDEQNELFIELQHAGKIRLDYQRMRALHFAGGIKESPQFPRIESLVAVYKHTRLQ